MPAPAFVPVKPTKVFPERPRAGENRVRFEPAASSRFRLVFQHAGERFYTGLYGLKPIDQDTEDASPPPSPLRFTADKFITADDILVSVIRVHNPTDRVQTIHVAPIVRPRTTFAYELDRQRLGAGRARGRRGLGPRAEVPHPAAGDRNCTASRSTSGSAMRCWTIPRVR